MRKMLTFLIPAVLLLLVLLSACNPDPFAATGDRPGIPVPETYNAEVARYSDVMVVEVVTVDSATSEYLNFNPLVTRAYDTNGDEVFSGSKRIMLMDGGCVDAGGYSGRG